MCASCGCGKLHDDHGDDRHLTLDDLEDAAEAAGIDVQEVAQNILQASQLLEREEAAQRQKRAG
jgi:hypothetical protein